MYTLTTDKTAVIESSTGTYIPLPAGGEAGNRYNKWLSEGNIPNPAAVPIEPIIVVSPWQIRKALNSLSLRELVESAVALADQTTKDAWQYATEFLESDNLVIALGTSLGKTKEEIHQIFLLAKSL